MVRMIVDRVELETGDPSLIVLRNEGADRLLVIAVGRAEAQAVDRLLRGTRAPRPLTHDLFNRILGRADTEVLRTTINRLKGSTFYARVALNVSGEETDVDARPSDGIAMALRSGAPIYASEKVLATVGMHTTATLPLPDKPVHRLNKREMDVFRCWMGFEPGAGHVIYPTQDERECRERRERWKRRYAGTGAEEPRLLIREEQIGRLKSNARKNDRARRWHDGLLRQAKLISELPEDFFESFIPDLGPWNPGGNFCPNCVHRKSPEGINNYFWNWDWRNPDRLECPYCGIVYPNRRYPENGSLHLRRLNRTYRFHVLEKELATDDWRLGAEAGRFVGQPIHVSFSGNIRSLKIRWALAQVEPLGIAYALTGRKAYVRAAERILLRMADVYPGYPLQSYFQDVVDADPGYATENADSLPTVLKRNACIGVYDGRYGYGHERTTTRTTPVATGLWGSSRIANELTSTGVTFLKCFQGYDLVKSAIAPEVQRRIEQDFLLELYLDTRAYDRVTNKAGAIRAARVAFGLVYGSKKELNSGLEGFRKIIDSQFHPDGSMKETPLYGHKPIGEDLWQIPEMLRGTDDFYDKGTYRAALQALADIALPSGKYPPLDDCFERSHAPQRTADIALERCGISIPGPQEALSEFALYNVDLTRREKRPASGAALNRYYDGRHLACVGYGTGKNRIQMYVLGEDGHRGHRHAGPLTVQLYARGREIFPDLGYICDHPGNQWVKATPSHQTVTVDGENAYPAGPSRLLGYSDSGNSRFVDMVVELQSGAVLRRALTLLRKPDGLPLLVDLFDVEGGRIHDYSTRVVASPGQLRVAGPSLASRRTALYQEHSFYPLTDFQTAGGADGGWSATWGRGRDAVRATVLTPCSELITYRSPGWRSQFEITALPDKYLDTVVLRNRRKRSRFVVVYEVLDGRPSVRSALARDDGEAVTVALNMGGRRSIQICTPGDVAEGSEERWKVRRSR
jgi:hypothetical protein